jgi:hypothetical protein
MMPTKGYMVKKLKEAGIRRGDKNGASVPLEHLKTYAIINLYVDTFGGFKN